MGTDGIDALEDLMRQEDGERYVKLALGVKCRTCNAKPGEMCASIVNAKNTRDVPHKARLLVAAFPKPPNDLDKARAQRAVQLEVEQGRNVAAMASSTLAALPDATPAEQLTALSIAVIKLSDAHGLSREDLIDSFSTVARELPFPAAVIE